MSYLYGKEQKFPIFNNKTNKQRKRSIFLKLFKISTIGFASPKQIRVGSQTVSQLFATAVRELSCNLTINGAIAPPAVPLRS
jgi:hypothetical protein